MVFLCPFISVLRRIAHIDLDSFFVSCERLKDPSLLGKPVVVGGTSSRGVVSSCSYEARQMGVHSAMPTSKAFRLCPEAVFLKGDMKFYVEKSKEVTALMTEAVPLFEKSSIDEFFIDMTGMDTYFDSFELLKDLRLQIKEKLGLPASFGYANCKTVAKIATNKAKPDGYLQIVVGEERDFLAPLMVGEIPMVGKKMVQSLKTAGFQLVRDIQNVSKTSFENRYGAYGRMIWNKANGIDLSEVNSFRERKSISTERTFSEDQTSLSFLESTIIGMIEQLTYQIRLDEKVISTIGLKLRYSDFTTVQQQVTVPHTAADHLIIPQVKLMLEKLYDSNRSVRLIGVRLAKISDSGVQTTMFEEHDKTQGLYDALDSVRSKHGMDMVKRAKSIRRTSQEDDKTL